MTIWNHSGTTNMLTKIVQSSLHSHFSFLNHHVSSLRVIKCIRISKVLYEMKLGFDFLFSKVSKVH